jgi:hypothetical protein
MDEISVLRRSRSDVPERAPEDVARGRAALFDLIERDSPVAVFGELGEDTPYAVKPATHRRRRVVRWAGFSAIGAATVIVALVSINVLGVGSWRGGADPAAAAALGSAALAAREATSPLVAPGQYLKIRTDAVNASMGSTSADVEEARRQGDDDASDAPTTAFIENTVRAVWIPADRSDDWLRVSCGPTLAQTFGPRSEALAAEDALLAAAQQVDSRQVLPGGRIDDAPFFGYTTGSAMSDDFAALPQNPRDLLNRIYDFTNGSGPSRDGEALVWIADTLRTGAVPPDIRSLLYDTAALIPDVTITEDAANLSGRVGMAIGRDEPSNGFRQDIIIDPATGEFIGERQVLLRAATDMPAGTALSSTAVTTTVVDAAPAGTELCGR